jgi:hypothetical protein
MRKLKTGFPGVPSGGPRDATSEIRGIVALDLRKIIGILDRVVVGDSEGGQAVSGRVVRESCNT